MNSAFAVEKMNIEPGVTVITVYYDAREVDLDTAYDFYKTMIKELPENKIFFLPNSFSLKLFDMNTLISLRDQINELLGDMADYE